MRNERRDKGPGNGLTRRKFIVRGAGLGGGALLGLYMKPSLKSVAFPAAYAAGTGPGGGGTPTRTWTESIIDYSDCFDLGTTTITAAVCPDGDLQFGENDVFDPPTVLRWNPSSVVGAYTSEAYADVDLSDVASLALGANPSPLPAFDKVAVIRTGTTHYKLEFMGDNEGAGPVTFRWEPLV